MAAPQYLIDLAKKEGTQLNFKLPGGNIVPAGVNPANAATFDLSQGVFGFQRERTLSPFETALTEYAKSLGAPASAGSVADLSTGIGQAVAKSFTGVNVVNPPLGLIKTDAGVTTPEIQANPPMPPVVSPTASITTVPSGLHTVAIGDTLSNIAAKYGVTLDQLLAVNPQFKQPGRNIDLIYSGEKVNIPGKGGTTPAQSFPAETPPVPPAPTTPVNLSMGGGIGNAMDFIKTLMTATNSLVGLNAGKIDLQNLRKQIQERFASQRTGTSLLEEGFKKFGINPTEILSTKAALNKEILATQEALRNIKPNLQKTLQDVGISEEQLLRLTEREAEPKRNTLARLLEQRGALASEVSDAMGFVKLFANTAMEDEAMKLKALEFDFNAEKAEFQDLREDQKFILQKAFAEKEGSLKLQLELAKSGTPQSIINAAANLTEEEILNQYGAYLNEAYKAPIHGTAENGYFTYRNGVINYITTPMGPKPTAAEKRDVAVTKYLQEKQTIYKNQNPTGYDGFVTAQDYQEALKKYIGEGGTQTNFFAAFPQQNYLRQQEIDKLPVAMKPAQIIPTKALTPDQVATINNAKAYWDTKKQLFQATPELRTQMINKALQESGFDISPYF